MKNKILSILILLSILVQGCKYIQSAELPPIPSFVVNMENLNNDLEIFLRKPYNTLKVGDEIILDIHLKSDIRVKTNSNFEVKMYEMSTKSNTWEEVPDLIQSNSGVFTFSTSDFVLDKANPNVAIPMHPVFDSKKEPVTLLITVKGMIINSNNEEIDWTGSYIIITLEP